MFNKSKVVQKEGNENSSDLINFVKSLSINYHDREISNYLGVF